MICPFCVEEVPTGSTQHSGCKSENNKPFPLFYNDFHGDQGSKDPVIFSVVGFSGHGKTVYLAALFNFLDHQLTDIWTGFAASVLDQDSLNKLNENRRRLRDGKLPERTAVNFPRPGIFRPSNMPHLADTTVLICDPPGEAFTDEERITELAGFVKRSNCILFLIDITALGDSAADEMAMLLETYVLGIRKMGIKEKFQHLVVVYTKADRMPSSIPEFRDYLTHNPELKAYLNEQRPQTLANPNDHLKRLSDVSNWLYRFTREELGAHKFTNLAQTRFESVTYTAITSLGAAPEGDESDQRLKTKMSPRCVVDPLLIVLDKSIKPVVEEPMASPFIDELETLKPPFWRSKAILVPAAISLLVLIVLLLVVFFLRRDSRSDKQISINPSSTPISKPSLVSSGAQTPNNQVKMLSSSVASPRPAESPRQPALKSTPEPRIAQATPLLVFSTPTPLPRVEPTPRPTVEVVPTPFPRPTAITQSTPSYQGPRRDSIMLSVNLEKDEELSVAGKLPGIPIRIDRVEPNDIFGIVEPPSPSNGWKRLVLRSRKKVHVVVTIFWSAL